MRAVWSGWTAKRWLRVDRLRTNPDAVLQLVWRREHSLPIAEAFWEWIKAIREDPSRRPKDPVLLAANYAHNQRAGLEVFLSDPDMPIDTNHLERALRVIPMGRRNWLFCWTELGAEHVGIIQSLIATCRLHGVDPWTWLVDVLPGGKPSRKGRGATDAAAVEGPLCRRSHDIRYRQEQSGGGGTDRSLNTSSPLRRRRSPHPKIMAPTSGRCLS